MPNEPDEQYDLEYLEATVRRVLATGSAARERGENWNAAKEEVLGDVRRLHGEILMRRLVGKRFATACEDDDIETARSLVALGHEVDVEGLGWNELGDVLAAEGLVAEVNLELSAEKFRELTDEDDEPEEEEPNA